MSDQAEARREDGGPYASLRAVLDEAFAQSAHGKGKARHANDRPFEQQPILEIGRMVGPGFALGQVMKKAQESRGMLERGEVDAASAELLGAIVYAASVVVLAREGRRLGGDVVAERDDSAWQAYREERAAWGEAYDRAISAPEVSPSVPPRPFKVGDNLRWLGLFDAEMYTLGRVYAIKSAPKDAGGMYGLTDDRQCTGAHSWPAEKIAEHFDLVEPAAPDTD